MQGKRGFAAAWPAVLPALGSDCLEISPPPQKIISSDIAAEHMLNLLLKTVQGAAGF